MRRRSRPTCSTSRTTTRSKARAATARAQSGVAEWNVVSRGFLRPADHSCDAWAPRSSTPIGPTAAPVAVVNESFARQHFQRPRPDWQAAEGRRLGSQDRRGRRSWAWCATCPMRSGVWGGSHPMVYQRVLAVAVAAESRTCSLRTAGDPAAAVSPVRSAVTAVDAGVPLRDVATMTGARAPIDDDPAIPGPALLVLCRARAGARADRHLRDHGASREPAAPRNRHPPGARRDEPADADGNTWRRPSAGAGGNRVGDGRGARRHTQHGGAPLSRGPTRSRRPRRRRGTRRAPRSSPASSPPFVPPRSIRRRCCATNKTPSRSHGYN